MNDKKFVLDDSEIEIDNLQEFFEVNYLTDEEKDRILDMEVGDTMPMGGQGCYELKRVQ